jgi:hypothetical protein
MEWSNIYDQLHLIDQKIKEIFIYLTEEYGGSKWIQFQLK